MKRIGLAVLVLLIASQNCLAGGVALSSTRVIYDGSKKETSLTVQNRSDKEEYLIQSWVDDVNGSKQTPFIITPPLFKLDAKKNNVLRIVNIKETLPQDRESVFWINVKAIPSESDENADKNVLQIAVRTRLKLFYRPVGLKGNPVDAIKQLHFQQQSNQIIVSNDSAFNLTFNKFSVNGKDIEKAGMVLAKNKLTINLPANSGKVSEVKYNVINDFGTSGDILTQRVE
ncbi:TPA: molecular chaperone LpfB [Enterobacter asburiae]|nr:molecular chaperone LpfB [Enterobacter asburiae]